MKSQFLWEGKQQQVVFNIIYYFTNFEPRCNKIVMMDDLWDYKCTIQNIVWTKDWINIKSRSEILSNLDIVNTNDTPIL